MNESTLSQVCLAGPVPKSYYIMNMILEHRKTLVSVTVGNMDRKEISFVVTQLNSVLK